MVRKMGSSSFKVIIVGAGLGGLSCAIACRREGLEVLILEKAPAITAVGWSCRTLKMALTPTDRCWDPDSPKRRQDPRKLWAFAFVCTTGSPVEMA